MFLAIDTSSDMAGLAIAGGGQILAELSWHCGRNHTVELLPHLELLLLQSALSIKDIRGIIVARGPGSFNGLRVGLGTAKGLAFSLGVPIAGVSTLEAAAYQHAEYGLPVCPVFDAGRKEIVCALYQLQNGEWRRLIPDSLSSISELCGRIREKTLFCGEPTQAMLEELSACLRERALIPPPEARLRRPGFLTALGEKRIKEGLSDDVATLQPIYLKRPHISQPRSRSAGAAPSADCR